MITPAIGRAGAGDATSAPLSHAQRALLFLQRLDPDGCHYHIAWTLRLAGALHVAALRAAIAEIVRRHAALRATFDIVDGVATQAIQPAQVIELPAIDVERLTGSRRDAVTSAVIRGLARCRFDLARGPLLRVTRLRRGPESHVLLFVLHHIAGDAWSTRLFARELTALYDASRAGRASPLPELSAQYADVIGWQGERIDSDAARPHLEYWMRQLAGAPALQLPTVRPRPAVRRHRGARFWFDVSSSLGERVRRAAREVGATPFMIVAAAYAALLQRYARQDDIVIGTPASGRNRTEAEPLIGLFVNTLALRFDLSGRPTVRALLSRVRQVALDAYAHQETPFERIVEALQPDRQSDGAPLCQVMLTLQNVPPRQWSLAGLSVTSELVDVGAAKLDVQLSLEETAAGFRACVTYDTDLFDEPAIARFADHFGALLDGMSSDLDACVSDLPILSERESRELAIDWNAAMRSSPPRMVHALFEAQVDRTPDAVAIVNGERHVTYGALNARANAIARALRRMDVGPDVPVGLGLEPSDALIAALVGILKAGGAYVPVDPEHPPERIACVLREAGAAVLVCGDRLSRVLPPHVARVFLVDSRTTVNDTSAEPRASCGAPENLAYVLFTSGSTGTPKGVGVEHRQLVGYVDAITKRIDLAPGAHAALVSSVAADLGNTILFPTLLTGATLHVLPDACVKDSRQWIAYNVERGIEYLKITPTHLTALMDFRPNADALPARQLILGGEASRCDWVADLRAARPACRVLNHYGPTECTVGAVTAALDGSACAASDLRVPLGRPLSNTRLFVVDRAGHLVPKWVPGELLIGGDGVARGYIGRPALTAAAFVPDRFGSAPGARLYRTGDLVRWREEGQLEFLGRADHQVKIRGFRVELGEIETALAGHPAVDRVVLVARDDERGGMCLVAYVVARGGESVSAAALHEFARRALPSYMVPASFVLLPELPLTPNGKVNRRALPPPAAEASPADDGPRTSTEDLLAHVWERVLRVPRLDLDASFFELGGHSVLAMQLVSRLRDACEVEVTLRDLFERPTVRGLARAIDDGRFGIRDADRGRIVRRSRDGDLPLSINQEGRCMLERLALARGVTAGPFHTIRVLRLSGALDPERLETALNMVLRHHEALRTGFRRSGRSGARWTPFVLPPDAGHLHLDHAGPFAAAALDDEHRRVASRLVTVPFDYEQPPLMRASLVRIDPDDHLLMLVVHHLLCDGWSFRVLLNDLASTYEGVGDGRSAAGDDRRAQYLDFAAWQRGWIRTARAREAIAYWTERWSELGSARLVRDDLPFARTANGESTDLKQHETLTLDAAASTAVKQYAREQGVTLYMIGLAAFQLVLHAYTGKACVAVMGHFANRTMPETEDAIGWFSNAHPLGLRCHESASIGELLHEVRAGVLAAHARQEVPETLMWPMAAAQARGGEVYVSFDLGYPMTFAFRSLSASRVRLPHATPHVAINVFVLDGRDGCRLSCDFSAEAFDADGVRAMLADIGRTLDLMRRPAATAGAIVEALHDTGSKRHSPARYASGALR